MPQNKDFALRLEIINECLRNTQRNWTLKNLIESVNQKLADRYGKSVKKRTIQADLKFLKEEKDAPIEKKKNGTEIYFYYSDSSYSIKNLPIKSEELSFLYDAINILRQINDFKIVQEVDEIINNLQNTVRTTLDDGVPIIQFEKHTTALGTEYIDNLFTAIKVKMAIRLSYKSFKSAVSKQFIVHPYLLKEYRNRWFLIGRKDDDTCISNFALDRIEKLRNSSHPFRINDIFDPLTYFNSLIGVTVPKDAEVEPIEIKISKNQAPYVLTKPIHHSQQVIKRYKNGSILIRLLLIRNYELLSVLLGYGSDLEVVAPLELRIKLKEIFEKSVTLYNK